MKHPLVVIQTCFNACSVIRAGVFLYIRKSLIRSNSRAARLVNQLLLMMHSEARIDRAIEPVPLTTLIQERMAELEPLASARKIELEFFAEDDVWIHGVRERLV